MEENKCPFDIDEIHSQETRGERFERKQRYLEWQEAQREKDKVRFKIKKKERSAMLIASKSIFIDYGESVILQVLYNRKGESLEYLRYRDN